MEEANTRRATAKGEELLAQMGRVALWRQRVQLFLADLRRGRLGACPPVLKRKAMVLAGPLNGPAPERGRRPWDG
jgi:hypothetical protein